MKDYYIAFNHVKRQAKTITGTRVSIGTEILNDKSVMAINLVDDEHYPDLEQYVIANMAPERLKELLKKNDKTN